MSRDEAFLAMTQGHCITHRTFASNEYLYRDKCGIIRDELGYNFTQGWRERSGGVWETDWHYHDGGVIK